MHWHTLLVPHDYSPCADRALALAADLAAHHQATIVLLHVTHLPPGLTADARISDTTGNMVRVDEYSAAAAARELDTRAAPVREKGIAVEVRSALGDVAEEIIRTVGAEKADLIVMGTHGRTGLAHVLLGSMAERVLRQSPVPVLTVRDEQDKRRTTSDLVLTDLATD